MTESSNFLQDGGCYVALTYDTLDINAILGRVRSPKAGALILFAGMPDSYNTSHIVTIFRYD